MGRKVYILLSHTIGGLSGSPMYVNNKSRWLAEHGWDVIVVDGKGEQNEPILLPYIAQMPHARIPELWFHPSWFNKSQIDRVINILTSMIQSDDGLNVVVESNTIPASEWGELLAKRCKGKHVIYLLGEHESISSNDVMDFYVFKAQHNSLYTISQNVFDSIFANQALVNRNTNRKWNAMISETPIEDVKCDELDSIEKADINIGYFGRIKPFFNDMFSEINRFAETHKDKLINFILLGVEKLPSNIGIEPLSDNVKIHLTGPKTPLPKVFFEKTDVIVATAACATISYKYGSKVISYNVKTNKPLGVLGYTTDNSTFGSGFDIEELRLSDLLESIFFDDFFYKSKKLPLKGTKRLYDYNYHLDCIEKINREYYDIFSIHGGNKLANSLKRVLIKLSLFDLLSYYRLLRNKLR